MTYEKKNIEELNLLDNFLFYEVASGEQGEWFCKLLIRAICGKEVDDIQVRPENMIQGTDTSWHGIRMDLYIKEKHSRCTYDFEPDQYTSQDVLPRRNRYYRALLDSRLLESGEEYDKLPDMWTVFIMPRDPFGKGRMCYTVKNVVIEDSTIRYEDGAVSLFLYTKGNSEGNEDLAQVLKYFEESIKENAKTQELKKLHNYVTQIKQRKEVGVRYMKTWEFERMWREEGRQEGQAYSIIQLLEDMGEISEETRQKINSEQDPQLLAIWLKAAAKAETLQEFEEKLYENH